MKNVELRNCGIMKLWKYGNGRVSRLVSHAIMTLGVCIFAYFHTSTIAYCGEAAPPPPVRMAYNYCTLAYSMAGYGEAEWRAEIERLAAKGYNAALVMAGMAKTWQLTLGELGASDKQIKSFIPDEWAQPWWLMGNLEGEGGPLTDEEIEKDAELGRMIVGEMKKRGIRPVLQGFTGIMPTWSPSLASLAGAKFVPQGKWNGYERPTVLAPTDPAFARVAEIWYANLKKVYGVDNVDFLAGDLFHEGGKTGDLDVTECIRAVQAAQQRALPGVVWMVQGWQRNPTPKVCAGLEPKFTIVEQLVDDMGNGADRSGGYGELPWIWCEVQNFGGNMGLFGGLPTYAMLGRAAKGKGAATFRGYGSLSEAYGANPVGIDLFEDMMMRSAGAEMTEQELDAWLGAWIAKRYGFSSPNSQLSTLNSKLHEAWRLLWHSVYSCRRRQRATKNAMTLVPGWDEKLADKAIDPTEREKSGRYWNPEDVRRAAEIFTEAGEKIAATKPSAVGDVALSAFAYDWANVVRQAIADRSAGLLAGMKGDAARQKAYLDCFKAMDDVTACVPEFRLDFWEEQARAKAGERGPRAFRRMITTWNNPHERQRNLNDYARREYAGLLRGYYMKRWEALFKFTGLDGKVDEKDFKAALNALEKNFWANGVETQPMPRDNLAALAERAKSAPSARPAQRAKQ